MQFSIGVEYSLHCLLYMVDIPSGKSVGIKDLSAYQGVSQTYLSKMFTKLRKVGIVKSVPGANGGYALAKAPNDINFWDVVEAVEGATHFFQCGEIRQNEIILDKDNLPESHCKTPCLIKVVMWDAEEQMRQYLRNKTLGWLHAQVKDKLPEQHMKMTVDWFNDMKKN